MAIRQIDYYNGGNGYVYSSTGYLAFNSSSLNTFASTGKWVRVPISNGRTYYMAFVTHDSTLLRHYAVVSNGTSTSDYAQYADTSVKSSGVKMIISYTCTDSYWKYMYVNTIRDSSFIGVWEAKSPTASDIDITDCVLDRNESDVYNLKQLKKKLMKYGLHSFYMRVGEVKYYDWPYADEYAQYLDGHRGAYNASDLNRVGSIVSYLATYLGGCITSLAAYATSKGVTQTDEMKMPYVAGDISVTPKTDWTYSDIPYTDTITTYLGNISNLRGLVPVPDTTPAVPTNLNYMTIAKANAIEQILHDVYYAAQDCYNAAKAAIDAASI